MYIDAESLITLVYFVVDNWYLTKGHKYLKGKLGRKPEFTDSEMITFMILKEFLQFNLERKFMGFMHGNYSDMFPDMVDQSQFNRRSGALRLITRTIAKITAYTFRKYLLRFHGVDTLTLHAVKIL